jgi:hypothetical protein
MFLRFEDATDLRLPYQDGGVREELPSIPAQRRNYLDNL